MDFSTISDVCGRVYTEQGKGCTKSNMRMYCPNGSQLTGADMETGVQVYCRKSYPAPTTLSNQAYYNRNTTAINISARLQSSSSTE